MRFVVSFVFGVGGLLVFAGISASQGWLESRADAVFLALLGWGIVATFAGGLLNNTFGQDHHGTSGVIGAAMMLAAVNVAIVIVAPIFVLLVGGAALTIGGVAAGIILVIGVLLTFL